MFFVEEVRRSETKNRTATITPGFNKAFYVRKTEKGRVITRVFTQKTRTLTEARKVAREWCQ